MPADLATIAPSPDLRALPDLAGTCAADPDCAVGRCCAGRCVDAMTDVRHCGGCGVACRAQETCCAGHCADLQADVASCGACGMTCTAAEGTPTCVKGVCAVGACNAGFADCDAMAGNGCETSVTSDLHNCGGCGKACAAANAATACTNGSCGLSSCNADWADCNTDLQDGCEVHVADDASNCGACGADCTSRVNAQVACAAGACTLTSCKAGFFDCDNRVDTGCEVDGQSSNKNCGGCGKACPVNTLCQAGICTCPPCKFPGVRMSSCQNLACVIDACFVGFFDCDKQVQNGCEVDASSDARNCGGCGMVCPQNAPLCLGGQCTNIGPSCADILKASPGAKSGVYTIDPDGNGPVVAFPAYCDMTSDGGGWTAFFAGINGSPNVFNHFEDTALDCADPSSKCLRRLPANLPQGSQFLATCGAASVRFTVNQTTFNYFATGVQGGAWMPNANQAAVAGNGNPGFVLNTWTGSGNNKGFIVSAGDAKQPMTFSSSYNVNNQWDYCNGSPDVGSAIRLFYR